MSAGEMRPLVRVLAQKTSLYFTRKTGAVFLRGKKLVVAADGREAEFPLDRIRRIALVGRAKVDAAILYRLMRCGIAIDWLDIFGRPLGQLLSLEHAREPGLAGQADFRHSEAALELARQTLLAKFDNCHEAIRRRISQKLPWAERREALLHAASAESLRGAEGMAARMYFSCWQELLPDFPWQGRHPHPAPDPVNMLLSLGYGFLRNRLASALAAVGLDPRVGFFHVGRGGHCALASDLMEPMRAFVDACVLDMLRRHELSPSSFAQKGGRCVCADRDLFVRLLNAFEDMFARGHVFYPSAAEPHAAIKCSLNDALDHCAESYARHLVQNAECFLPRLAPCRTT